MSRNVTLHLSSIPFAVASVGDTLRLTVKQDEAKVRKVDVLITDADTERNTVQVGLSSEDAERVSTWLVLTRPLTLNVKRRNGIKVDHKGIVVESVSF